MQEKIINAETINAYLENGGKVMICTYARATVYGPKHAGWFSTDDSGSVYVRRGKGKDCIGFKSGMLVGVRFGK